MRRVGLDGNRCVGERQKGSHLHVGDARRHVGLGHDPGAAVPCARHGPARRRSRGMDRHLRVCRRGRLRRDLWIGIWSIVFAAIATFVWEKGESGRVPDAREVWWRFPKFVIGFFVASMLMSAFTGTFSTADFNSAVRPNLLAPLASFRTWTFIFCFLSIGLTTRFRDLHVVGWKAFWSFTIGVAVNVILGYFLSVAIFGSYWAGIH